ncbi:LysE family translocator [Saccharomonospora xinjiangensis]|nr:Leucine efflux protein [Saccharomonospora xinjiangensis]
MLVTPSATPRTLRSTTATHRFRLRSDDVTWSTYGSYLILVVLVVLAPGPDTVVTLKNSFAGGFRGGLVASAGIAAGNLVQGTAVAFGLGALIVRSQPVFQTLRWIGVIYLCYLGVQALRSARRGEYAALDGSAARSGVLRRFREGFLSNVTNPKVLALYLSVLPQFIDPAHHSTGDTLLLAYTFAVLGAVWLLLLVAFVHTVRVWFQRRSVRRGLDVATGTTLIGFGAALAIND